MGTDIDKMWLKKIGGDNKTTRGTTKPLKEIYEGYFCILRCVFLVLAIAFILYKSYVLTKVSALNQHHKPK